MTIKEILRLWDSYNLQHTFNSYPNTITIRIWRNYSADDLSAALEIVTTAIETRAVSFESVTDAGKYITGIMKRLREQDQEITAEIEAHVQESQQ